MKQYLFTPNEYCHPEEVSDALSILFWNIIASGLDVSSFTKGERQLFIESTDDLSQITKTVPFFNAVLGETNSSIEARFPYDFPKWDQHAFTVYKSEQTHFVWDWIENTVTDKDNGKTLSIMLPNAFLFPNAIYCVYDGLKIFCCQSKNYNHVVFPDIESMKKEFRAFVKIDDTYIHDDRFLNYVFDFMTDGNIQPVAHMYKETIQYIGYLPEIYPQAEMRNSMKVWLPVAEKHAKSPETVLIPIPMDLYPLCDGFKTPKCWRSFLNYVKEKADQMGYPLFLRTDFNSNKHNVDNTCWFSLDKDLDSYNVDNTCWFSLDEDLDSYNFYNTHRISSDEDLDSHITNIINFSTYLNIPFTSLALRKWINGDVAWYAKEYGRMPVRKEFRFFVEGGKVTHIQPYWPEEAFKELKEIPEYWRNKLDKIMYLSPDTGRELSRIACEIVKELRGNWSVDFLDSYEGWVLTDMALAHRSYKYAHTEQWKKILAPICENNPYVAMQL